MSWNGLIVAALFLCQTACFSEGANAQEKGKDTAPAASVELPKTGPDAPANQSYDRRIAAFIERWNLPGGSVAVARHGRLVLARGYGYADVESKQEVQPNSLFRVASVSKPITAVTILKLVEQGKLQLDDKVCDVLGIEPSQGGDERWREITLRRLLQHTGGWNRDTAFDPMFRPFEAAEKTGEKHPASAKTVIRYMLGLPLQFSPGEEYSYSNFGYCLLGRVIEAKTQTPYDVAVKKLVLTPCGIRDMQLGHSLRKGRARHEVQYYPRPADETNVNVFGDRTVRVAAPDGGFHLEAMDSHGGWIASAVDLMRFVTAVEGSREPRLLTADSIRSMTMRTAPPVSVDTPTYYGLGWNVRPTGESANWWHGGSLPGTATLLVRASEDLCWVALFNARPDAKTRKSLGNFSRELDDLLWKAAQEVKHWGDGDLFAELP